MRKQLLFILFGLISVLASGQALKSSKDSTLLAAPYSTSGESYVIPWTPTDASVLPSPEAVWQNRYISNPVSYSTGTVQISNPLCHLPVKDIPLDVSLSYHTGRVKVDDVPGSVGLGWTLQAGGGISRVIHGHPDELHPFKMRTRQEVMQNNDLKFCYGSSAVLTASCRIPGFRPEEAVIYYGKVRISENSTVMSRHSVRRLSIGWRTVG